ncbi:MAG: pseudouridine synthase [Desulforhabdus sp.]|jgi:23S rRNA pseudouridine2605 synthase|nr:pseudouridine synthase [Desulforhabdus sp.]
MTGIRLQRVIAQAGLASRRAAEEMIRQGRVVVNGRVVTELGARVDPLKDKILVDRRSISPVVQKIHLLFYKPRECVTTAKDPQGRKTVMDYIADLKVRLFPVGRLDYDAEGLIILTNDGDLAHRLQHPRFGVGKTYRVKVKGHPSERALAQLRDGVQLEEGTTAPADVSIVSLLEKAAWLEIVLHQGWNRQIKRMCEAVGHPVLKIKRTEYGPLKLGRLIPGTYRMLKSHEVEELYRLVQLNGGS